MELTFEKWEDGRWFVVLPDYDGDQEDLEYLIVSVIYPLK